MKNAILSLVILISIQTAIAQQIIIKGDLATHDSIRVILSDMRKADTLWITNGHFQLERTFAGTTYSLTTFYPKQQRTMKKNFFPHRRKRHFRWRFGSFS